ncbi:uncharacterized protein [Haliotis cracherodii]|uniref:uncharacterized protein n=1 Tax=Haliotis cracherodii TaxID=6455 RepID=UPI0039E9CEBB
MEEDLALGRLVAQRKQRPVFARMISWEITPHEAPGGTTCDQVSNSDSAGDASSENEAKGDNSNDSDESEYFSAEERTSLSDSDTDLLNQSTDNKAIGEAALVSSDNTDSVFDSVDNNSNQTQVGRDRAPSKKQKKRRKDRLKMQSILYADYDAPFRNVENIDFEVADLVGYSDENSRPNIRNVPTLFELCICSISTKGTRQKRQSTSSMPRPMKHVLYERRRDQAFTSIQLSWLYRLLAYIEKQEAACKSTCTLKARNIWNDDYCAQEDYTGGEVTSILPYSYINYKRTYYSHTGWHHPFYRLSVVASVIEIMLPQHISAGRLRHSSRDCSSESQLVQKATDAMVSSVREVLKKRYPAVVEDFFDKALPYVFWARGNLKFAAECFVRLALTNEDNARAMLLSEAARLYAQNEEPQKASRLYIEASDTIVPKSRSLKLDKDVLLQQFTMMASVYDQGVMTPEKASLAAGAWAAAIKYLHPTCPWSSGIQAVESFLCFHAGTAQERVQDHLQKSVKLIESLVGQSGVFLLHLSLVKALLGATRESLRAFSSALTSGILEIPSSLRGNPRKHTPWQPVLDHVAEHGPPKFLKVIWRTQLGHLRIVNNKNSFESDYQAKDLNLRLTDAGFLTADLQMVLPPIRALNLDPYTGLQLHTSGLTSRWHSLPYMQTQNGARNRNGLHTVPTLTEVYRDPVNETVIYLLSPDSRLLAEDKHVENSRQMTLFWRAAGGQRAKLNLIPFVKEVYRKKIIDYITASRNRTDGASWKEKMKMSLEYCFVKGYSLSNYVVERVMEKKWNKIVEFSEKSSKKTNLSKTKKKDETGKKKAPCLYEPPDFSLLLEECFAYKDTLYLAVWDDRTSKRVQVFVDCSNKASFLEPVVTMDYSYDSYNDEGDPKLCSVHQTRTSWKQHTPKEDIMWHIGVEKETNQRKQFVFGKKGELLKTISDNQMEAPHVLGKKLYGLTDNKLRVRCDPITADEVLSEEFPVIKTLLFGGEKVMAVTDNAIFFLHPDTLQTMTVTKQQDSNLEVSEDGRYISFLPGSPVRILEQKKLEEKTRLAVGIGAMLIFVDVTDDAVEIVMDLLVPGVAVECYSISGHGEFLVSTTLQEGGSFYREHVFHYDRHGKILGVLPFLGPGPRCFSVEYLKGWEDETNADSECGRAGWHVFMRDGHEGIIGVRL